MVGALPFCANGGALVVHARFFYDAVMRSQVSF